MNRLLASTAKATGWLMLMMWLMGMAACHSPGQVITVDFADGSRYQTTYPTGGTLDAPAKFAKEISAIDLPNRMGILLCSPGIDSLYRSITIDRSVIFIPGSKRVGRGMNYIPNNPMAYRQPFGNQIKGYETIPILFHNDAYRAPDAATIARTKLEFDQTTQLSKILKKPRLLKMLQTLDDRQQPVQTAFGDTDMGWQIRNWQHTAGGKARIGWHNGVQPRGGGGYDNNHYNRLQYLLYSYLNDPNQNLYEFGLRQIISHACQGRTWFGPKAGFRRYEKGNDFIGQNFSDNSMDKQWSGDIISWYRMTNNPILGMQIDLMRAQLKRSNPDTVWQGFWGARVGARYLEELLIHYLHRREGWIVDKAAQFIANCLAWRDTDYCWDNRGSPVTESPWMQTQLVAAIFKWYEHRPELKPQFPVAELMNSGEAIWRLGSNRVYGKPMLYYRFRGATVLAPSMHLTSFALPMLRFMAATDNATWGRVSSDVETFITDFAGTDVGNVAANIKVPISALGYRYPRQGFGWSKAMLFYLESMR